MDYNFRIRRFRRVASPCQVCGRETFRGKRGGRRREFCSDACKQAQFRNKIASLLVPYLALRNVENTAAISIASKGVFRRRAWPIWLVGGCGLSAGLSRPIDPPLRRAIIDLEVGPEIRRKTSTSSPDKYLLPPDDDHWRIPDFLRRKRPEVGQC